ncbi:MAG: Hsp20/alpha crystallin family protein [Verrucomicrobiae bacterium]|nr:Hsp20/alpha crystallin family protein [Verrucomicrobiae bacterium]MCP5521965.1 Hsp20/alpha crystallin family protein [Verrucomicrobiales bacterium]
MAANNTFATLPVVRRSPSTGGRGRAGTWVPNTDVYLSDKGLVIKVEIAGMRKEDLELTIESNQIRIRGNREDGCRSSTCSFVVMEINYGRFESLIELPEGYDLSASTAAYQNGFLRVDVPFAPRSRGNPVSVPISTD